MTYGNFRDNSHSPRISVSGRVSTQLAAEEANRARVAREQAAWRHRERSTAPALALSFAAPDALATSAPAPVSAPSAAPGFGGGGDVRGEG